MMEGRGPTHRLLFIVLPQVGDVRGWPGKAAGSRSQDRCVHGYSFGMLFCCNLHDLSAYSDQFLNMVCVKLQEYKDTCTAAYR